VTRDARADRPAAFLVSFRQSPALLGDNGLLPVRNLLARLRRGGLLRPLSLLLPLPVSLLYTHSQPARQI
jgi:hypothetical protein